MRATPHAPRLLEATSQAEHDDRRECEVVVVAADRLGERGEARDTRAVRDAARVEGRQVSEREDGGRAAHLRSARPRHCAGWCARVHAVRASFSLWHWNWLRKNIKETLPKSKRKKSITNGKIPWQSPFNFYKLFTTDKTLTKLSLYNSLSDVERSKLDVKSNGGKSFVVDPLRNRY